MINTIEIQRIYSLIKNINALFFVIYFITMITQIIKFLNRKNIVGATKMNWNFWNICLNNIYFA